MRFKISKLMVITAAIGVNIAWVRAFLITEATGGGEFLRLFDCVFLIFFVLQFGLWRYLRSKGRRRRFWLGFVVSGLVGSVAMWVFSESEIELLNWYAGTASDLSYYILSQRIDAELSTRHWDLFMAILFFLPELIVASLGGLLAACWRSRDSSPRLFAESPGVASALSVDNR